jgi:hypothetical protein
MTMTDDQWQTNDEQYPLSSLQNSLLAQPPLDLFPSLGIYFRRTKSGIAFFIARLRVSYPF